MFLKYEQSAKFLYFLKKLDTLHFYSLFNHRFVPDFGRLEAEHIYGGCRNVRETEVLSAELYLVLIGGEVIVNDKGYGI